MNVALIILLSIVLSAFFSGMEIAFISANKLKIELDRKQGNFGSRIISFFSEYPGQYIATMLVGNNIALVIYGIMMAIILEPLIVSFTDSHVLIITIQTIVSTLFILLTAEFLPKTVFIIDSNFALKIFSVPVFIFYILLYPLTRIVIVLSRFLIRILTGKPLKMQAGEQVFGRIDLDHFLSKAHDQANGVSHENDEIRIFQNVLDLSNVRIRDCMVPRNEIVALEENSTIEELKQILIETGLSKIIIYKETTDNVIGYFHSKEIFKDPPDIKSRLINLPIVPETMPANKLLQSFIKEHKGIALVVDEFGGTSGIVTMEDILEEIVGEIEDEHDYSELVEKKIGENDYIFSGRHEIDYLNNTYNLQIPKTDEYETLAGLILFYHESIPKVNEKIILEPFIFKILDVSQTRIELVHLIKTN
jgi:CBS domain containing-hemolysin-like protein